MCYFASNSSKYPNIYIIYILHIIVYLVYRSFIVSFSHGVQVYPVPPSLSSRRHCYAVYLLCLWWSVVVGGCMWGIGVSGGVVLLCEPWRAYLNMFSPATSSHCGRFTLIRYAGTRDPRMQWWVARTKVITILLLTYPHVFE